ncbi:acetyl/propionyl/methylcrotonyl-CoA carboxylase subunit alpha [Marinomonas sp. 15G1-11]|uniref:Acetyl/propionyl/methylcrotonyl-CoA carboxylase subunit alpha n=1 Tax=Marinomonas phaeophyticola TaxID=3004091 RepID=A0ABT4JZ89_9GAMM|nr:acetyl/propionyl/methylcrotonyl-CoA carboxylase subunit alpha [Marinomonas sp. 15G1-11]MCZ2723711.1 acetyl/propionyl/methylcrotonyl-CoA carboxylase subunit alpha [Marinomonas sp. 15G1-11]
MFHKILIANRGEIACRVIQTAQKMGIRCVAVYSEADRHSRHVSLADEAYLLGPAASSESYLRQDKILDIALRSGAQAIHPGYGFLSENKAFAENCAQHDLVFIGPPSSAIAAMGSKSAAKAIMENAGVPLVPGYHGNDQTPKLLRDEALKCGFPLLLKAVAGGGGKGMRVVENMGEFDDALSAAKREAQNAFGNSDMLIERYLTQPRHVEIQVFCDTHGNGVYLSERDCSIQRRHQKVLEEAPAPNLSQETRKAMGEAAVKAAQAIDYVGAGTVEFLYDVDGSFFFMEMNTRLQVEHPVTEMITRQDLVEWQLRIAHGQTLPLQQDQIRLHGHALEARIYAEDPNNDFLPATGTLRYLKTPAESQHVRVDTGVIEGDEVSIHYDPMIAKLIVWDESREQAIERMVQALTAYRIDGVTTNIEFLHTLSNSNAFRAADLTTNFIEKHQADLVPEPSLDKTTALILASCFFLQDNTINASSMNASPFVSQHNWRLNNVLSRKITISIATDEHDLEVITRSSSAMGSRYLFSLQAQNYEVETQFQEDQLVAFIDGQKYQVHASKRDNHIVLFSGGQNVPCTLVVTTFEQQETTSAGSLKAPMNGSVVDIFVQPGQAVKQGQTLIIVEAMKMEHAIKAPKDGIVEAIFFIAGELVSDGAELLSLQLDGEES